MSFEPSDAYSINIYEEPLDDGNTIDLSFQYLESLPKLKNLSVVVLYLQNNKLTKLPDDFFPSLTCLMYLDLRENRLVELPTTIKTHAALTHLLLQNNCLTSLPNELGTVALKVLQLNGNPLIYPPKEVIDAGKAKTLTFLRKKYLDSLIDESQDSVSTDNAKTSPETLSFNSIFYNEFEKDKLKIQLNEKCEASQEEYYPKLKGKCPKLDKSRHKTLPPYCQSAKYLKPLYAEGKIKRDEKIKQNYLKDMAIAKKKALLASTDKILQERKNLERLKSWRNNYRTRQFFNRDSSYRLNPKDYPYDTSPEYMTLLTREDIEKDLPDKYRKKLSRRSKPTAPRKANNDVHLAMKIKKLFENLEALDLNKGSMTPRTEQKVLLNEIQKISEIKQKLMELSTSNLASVSEI